MEIFVIARHGTALERVGLADIGPVDDAQLANLVSIAVTEARVPQAKH